jgi:predicted MFS family arabinose efflux permease
LGGSDQLDPSDSLPRVLVLLALLVAGIGSLGAPLITSVATEYGVSLAAAQWTLTVTLLTGAVTTPVLGRLGSGPRRRTATLATLVIVTVGSVLTVLPGSFALLVVGRAAQGVGLGMVPLLMATARETLDPTRSTRTIGMLSVATTAAIGIGYPLAGLLTDLDGVRTAYLAGLMATALALLTGLRRLPPPPATGGAGTPMDWAGATLLGLSLIALLVPTGDGRMWSGHATLAGLLLVAAVILLAVWCLVETHVADPLVDLRALRHPPIARANLAMFVGGGAMYLLLSLATRFLQTPPLAGYGYALNTFEAGLALVPFSIAGFVSGRMATQFVRRIGAARGVAASTVLVALGFVVFVVGRPVVAGPVLAVAVLGFGVGGVSAAMPAMILAETPASETSSAMSVNQVVRSVGFSMGSALGGLLLSARVQSSGFPQERGYVVASTVGLALALAAAAVVGIGGKHT